jgi:hypothetical protein
VSDVLSDTLSDELEQALSDVLSRRRTKAGRTQRVVLNKTLEHQATDALPTNNRFVFYECEQDGNATKPADDDNRRNRRRSHGWPPGDQDVSDALTYLREHGVIPWDWIVDESRDVTVWRYGRTTVDYVRDELPAARTNPWGDGPPPVIVCESRATGGVLERVAAEYCCPVGATGGQATGYLRTKVVPVFTDLAAEFGTVPEVLYLGDLDLSGEHIEANTRRVLQSEVGRLRWTRVAMTEAIAAAKQITPIMKRDGRTKRTHPAIEVESLGQAALIALVRAALDDRMPEPLDDVLERDRAERDRLAAFLDLYPITNT